MASLTALLLCQLLVLPPVAGAAGPLPLLRVGLWSAVDSLNPFTVTAGQTRDILQLQYGSMVEWDAQNRPTAGMADQWTVSSDGLTWSYHLPSGRRWSDGTPVTAQDAVFTFRTILDQPRAARHADLAGVSEVSAPDASTVVITLTRPQAANPASDVPIVPAHVWSQVQDPIGSQNLPGGAALVGSGPFVVSTASQARIDLRTNPNFWRGPARLSGISYLRVADPGAALAALQAGELDLATDLPAELAGALGADSRLSTVSGVGDSFLALGINAGSTDLAGQPVGDGNPALQKPEVRRAIAEAIDRQGLLNGALHAVGQLADTPQPPAFPQWTGLPEGVAARVYDSSAAEAALDAAGYPRGSDGLRVGPDGTPLTLRLWGRSEVSGDQQVLTTLSAFLNQVGIQVSATLHPQAEIDAAVRTGGVDLHLVSGGGRPDPDALLQTIRCAARVANPAVATDALTGSTLTGWCDPELDSLIAAQSTEGDADRRAELVRQAWARLQQQDVWVPLAFPGQLDAYRPDTFTGFTRVPGNGPIGVRYSYRGLYSVVGVPQTASPAPTAEVVQPVEPASRAWIGWLVGGAVVLLGAGGWWLRRRTRAAAPAPAQR